MIDLVTFIVSFFLCIQWLNLPISLIKSIEYQVLIQWKWEFVGYVPINQIKSAHMWINYHLLFNLKNIYVVKKRSILLESLSSSWVLPASITPKIVDFSTSPDELARKRDVACKKWYLWDFCWKMFRRATISTT